MEDILHKQVQRLSKKSASLETLYGVSIVGITTSLVCL
jgi:predicted amino acid racemase